MTNEISNSTRTDELEPHNTTQPLIDYQTLKCRLVVQNQNTLHVCRRTLTKRVTHPKHSQETAELRTLNRYC